MIFDITRLTNIAGQDFDSPKCRVRSPHITARDSIEIGGYIVAKQEKIAELEKSNKTLMQNATDLERELWLANQSKAVAPEMYEEIQTEVEELQEFLLTLEHMSNDWLYYSSRLDRKEALLAKARGEQ